MFLFKKKRVEANTQQNKEKIKEENKVELDWNSIGEILNLLHDETLDNQYFIARDGQQINYFPKTPTISKIYRTYKYKEEITVDENIKIIIEANGWYKDIIHERTIKMLRAVIYIKTIKIETFILNLNECEQIWELNSENINYRLDDSVKKYINDWASKHIQEIERKREIEIKERTEKAKRKFQRDLDILNEIWDIYKEKVVI